MHRALAVTALAVWMASASAQSTISVAYFEIDVTPPIGTPLCGGSVKPAMAIDDPLSARGLVLLPKNQAAIVLCAVDWVGIANASYDDWRGALASAADTTPERVAVHTLHQHDAPFVDQSTEELIAAYGLGGQMYDVAAASDSIQRAAKAVSDSVLAAVPVTHVSTGKAVVDRVASNRRILGEDGRVEHVRWTATADSKVRAFGVGTIDPYVRCIGLWNEGAPVAALTYYATHPQSNYGRGRVSADFVGMARSMLEHELPGVKVVHFNGAGGNVGAGKYNNGAIENRTVLAERLFEGMRLAWEFGERTPVSAADVTWLVHSVALPLRDDVDENHERVRLADEALKPGEREQAAHEIVWMERVRQGHKIDLSLLNIGPASILHMPGELFVEYQLAAQAMRPEGFVAMASYGEYGPGYIGTRIAYTQGGYEDAVYVSRTAPKVEVVLLEGMRALLEQSR